MLNLLFQILYAIGKILHAIGQILIFVKGQKLNKL